MKTMRMLMTMVIGSASAAYAGMQSEGTGVLTYFFIGFFALIIVSQLIPAMILFFGMVKGVFARQKESPVKSK